MQNDTATRVTEIVGQVLARPVSRADDGAKRLRDLGLGSLRMIRLLSDLEAAFQIRVNDDQVTGQNFGTLEKLIAFVEGQVGGQQSSGAAEQEGQTA